ncbi:hypothetical protein, partial [Salmonella sp. s55044]|uniref:hypothetical protein n=1 Tax=Salmonella sp. s55044 TaxID=3159677 RepID=UPI0039806D40
ALLRKTLFGLYENGIDDLTSRLDDNLYVIDSAVNDDNAVSTQPLGSQPNVAEKRGQQFLFGQGTSLPLYVLSLRLAQLQYEENMRRNIEKNERIFEQYG